MRRTMLLSVYLFGVSFYSFSAQSQIPCTGKACPVIKTRQTISNNIQITYFENVGLEAVIIRTRPAVGLGGPCGDAVSQTVGPSQTVGVGGGFCDPFEANYRPFEPVNIVTLGQQNFETGTNVIWGGPMAAQYGADTLINDPPNIAHEETAIWRFMVADPPVDLAWSICYAAGESRPVEFYLNDVLIKSNAAAETTGGWTVNDRKCIMQGRVSLKRGENTVRIHRNDVFPHIWRITFNQIHP